MMVEDYDEILFRITVNENDDNNDYDGGGDDDHMNVDDDNENDDNNDYDGGGDDDHMNVDDDGGGDYDDDDLNIYHFSIEISCYLNIYVIFQLNFHVLL